MRDTASTTAVPDHLRRFLDRISDAPSFLDLPWRVELAMSAARGMASVEPGRAAATLDAIAGRAAARRVELADLRFAAVTA